MLNTLYKIRELHFRFLGTNDFYVKAKNERFTAASSRCRQNLKYENYTSSIGRLRQNIASKACRTCSTIIFLYSANQIIDLWRCRWQCRRQILNSLPSQWQTQRKCHKLRIWLAVECIKLSVPLVLHALNNNSVPSSAKQQLEIVTFEVLMTTWTDKYWILDVWFCGAHTSPVVAHFANIVKIKQDGKIAK